MTHFVNFLWTLSFICREAITYAKICIAYNYRKVRQIQRDIAHVKWSSRAR